MMSLARHAPVPGLPIRRIGFPLRGLGLLPLMAAMSLIYWPKIIESDTQPWVSGAVVLAFLAYWPGRRKYPAAEGVIVLGLALAAIAAFGLRGAETAPLLRYSVILGTFALLWLVGLRDRGELLVRAVRWCIIVWFAVGLYQVIAVRAGLPVTFVGRYVVGRSGVPSLTAEASFYGSISVVQIMYLITNRDRRDLPYICMAALSVLFSGSALALLMLAFPLARLPNRLKLLGGGAMLIVLLSGYHISDSSFFQRLKAFDFQNAGALFVLQDPSTNLRVGHTVFTLWDNLWRELTFQNSVGFQLEYLKFSERSGLFIPNGSDAILPSGGELLFRSGFVGLLLIAALMRHAWFTADLRFDRFEKLVFVAVCLVSPIALINPFFVFYIQKRYANP
jgi:hypothetical protein